MAGWRERWYTFTSFIICALVVVLGTVLYPLILILFSGIALLYPLRRREGAAPSLSRERAPGRTSGK